jgi:hypothetical protein
MSKATRCVVRASVRSNRAPAPMLAVKSRMVRATAVATWWTAPACAEAQALSRDATTSVDPRLNSMHVAFAVVMVERAAHATTFRTLTDQLSAIQMISILNAMLDLTPAANVADREPSALRASARLTRFLPQVFRWKLCIMIVLVCLQDP